MWTAAGWKKPSTELWCDWKRRWQLVCVRGQTQSRAGAWQGQLMAWWSLASRGKAEMWAPPHGHTGFSRTLVHLVCSSSMVPLSCLKIHFCRSKKQKGQGNLKGRSCAMYRNCDDSKSSLQASFAGKQDVMIFRLLPNIWPLRPCDWWVFSDPVFFAVSDVAVL